MKRAFTRTSLLTLAFLGLLAFVGKPWLATGAADDPPGRSIADKLGLPTSTAPQGKAVKMSATFLLEPGKRRGKLQVTAKIAPGNHVYSVTQKPGGPLRTKISMKAPPKVKLLGAWVPNKKPKIKTSEFFPVPVEEHHGTVTWTALFEVPAGTVGKNLKLQLKIDGQVCTDDLMSCMEVKETVTAKYSVPKKPSKKIQPASTSASRPVPSTFVAQQGLADDPFASASAGYEDPFGHVTLDGQATPRTVTAGGSVRLSFTISPAPPYHVYDYAPKDPDGSVKPTLLVVKVPEGWQTTGPETDGIPELPADPAGRPYYDQPVTWTLTVKIPEGTAKGEYELTGGVGYQVCKDDACDPPAGVDYSVRISVAAETQAEPVALVMKEGSYSKINQLASGTTTLDTTAGELGTESGETSLQKTGADSNGQSAGKFLQRLQVHGGPGDMPLLWVLVLAFAAGFILNFMPCVLPVIGLKIVSFVQQAGESRQRIFALNLWFSLGLISVFMVLAVLAKVAGFGWGDQFRSLPFNIILTAVVFVFALSFLGVWEIPIPGFVASGKVSEVAEQEGPAGAFCKGVLTTVLATPCSGPLLVPALTWAVAQPAVVTFLGFFCVGLGMAFPYLLIGANPKLINYLPKPGAWMETFKNIMGFVLLGTVVFLMTIISSISIPAVMPVFTFLIGLWAACWWVGRTPLTAEFSQQVRAWCGGLLVAACAGWLAFGFIDNMMTARYQGQAARDVEDFKRMAAEQAEEKKTTDAEELAWRPYSTSLLKELVEDGKPVFVDFTADW